MWGGVQRLVTVPLENCSKYVLCVPAVWTSDAGVGVCLCAHGPKWELSSGMCGEELMCNRLQREGGTGGRRRGHLLAS